MFVCCPFRLFKLRVAELKQQAQQKRQRDDSAAGAGAAAQGGRSAKVARSDAGEHASGQGTGDTGIDADTPDEGWSLLTVAPVLAPAIDVAGAAAAFRQQRASAAASGAQAAGAAAAEGGAAVRPTHESDDSDEGDDYLDALNMDWRAKTGV